MDPLLEWWNLVERTVTSQIFRGPENFIGFVFNLVLAVIVVVVGRWLARKIRAILYRTLTQAELSPSLINLFTSATYYGIIFLAVVLGLAFAGVPLDSLIFVIGVVVVILGIALQDSLGNLAAAVIFLLFQPFKIGDIVETAGVMGEVQEIQMFRTVIVTRANTAVSIPNVGILDSNIINYSQQGIVRLDLEFTVSYGDDLLQAKTLLQKIISNDSRVLTDPAPIVGVKELGDNGVTFVFRPFVKTEDMWRTRYALTEQVKLAFDEAGITIPFPQRDVHIHQEREAEV